jgi:OmcA/MtrC family decaheme c-type cytochrome
MRYQRFLRKTSLTVLLLVGLVGLSAAVKKANRYSPFDKEFYLSDAQIAFVRPGLNVTISDYSIAEDGSVKVRFQVTDDGGQPLDLDGVYTPGAINISFLIASIPQDKAHYVAYTTRNVTSPITNQTAVQPTADSGGRITRIELGTYEYAFGRKLPAGYDRSATHSIGFYAQRNLADWNLGTPMDDGVVTFVPDGSPVEKIRELTTDEACSQCHGFLRVHGRRHSYQLCILCHYPGVIDPDTGNTVDMPVMTHKIHMGLNLPSVKAGTPYKIIGFGQSVHDYSHVGFPQDLRYCDTCHVQEAAQAEAWYLNPNRAACGSCHDDVNLDTGENHAGGPTLSDDFCASCHFPQGELEFDASVIGAHTREWESSELEGLNLEVLGVSNAGPGQKPTVWFKMTNNAGEPVNPADLNFFNVVIAGPTTDYTLTRSEAARVDSVPAANPGEYTYTLKNALPQDAEGTFVVGLEAYRNVTLLAGTTKQRTVRETAENPVHYFSVTDTAGPAEDGAVPRRVVVTDEKCEACHRNLRLHGTIRHDATAYCQVCHTPVADDSPFRPADQFPAQSIDFKMMIHRIHTGEELTREYTQIGFGGRVVNYNHVLYPNNLADCRACHVGTTYTVPSPGVVPTIALREFFSPIRPNSAACLGCHDSIDAAAHAYVNTAPFGESCAACHAEGRDFAVTRSHAQ